MKNFKTLTSLCMALATLLTTQGAVAADEPWMEAARAVATAVPPKLLQVLTDAIAQSGAEWGRHPDQDAFWCHVMQDTTLMQAMAC